MRRVRRQADCIRTTLRAAEAGVGLAPVCRPSPLAEQLDDAADRKRLAVAAMAAREGKVGHAEQLKEIVERSGHARRLPRRPAKLQERKENSYRCTSLIDGPSRAIRSRIAAQVA